MRLSGYGRVLALAVSIVLASPQQNDGGNIAVAVPPELDAILPACARGCLVNFLRDGYQIVGCTETGDIDCYCGSYSSGGFTLGEGGYACLSASCPREDATNATAIYNVCTGRGNPVFPVHSTLTITNRPTSTLAAPSLSLRASSLISLSTPSSSSSTLSRSTSSVFSSTFTPPRSSSTSQPSTEDTNALSTAQIVGISVACVGAVVLSLTIAVLIICYRQRKARHEADNEKSKSTYYPDDSPPRLAVQYVPIARYGRDPRGGLGGVGLTTMAPVQQVAKEEQRESSEGKEPPGRTWPAYYAIHPDDIGVAVGPGAAPPPRKYAESKVMRAEPPRMATPPRAVVTGQTLPVESRQRTETISDQPGYRAATSTTGGASGVAAAAARNLRRESRTIDGVPIIKIPQPPRQAGRPSTSSGASPGPSQHPSVLMAGGPSQSHQQPPQRTELPICSLPQTYVSSKGYKNSYRSQNRPESTQTVFEEDSPASGFSRQSRQLRSSCRSPPGLESPAEVDELSPVPSTVSSQRRRESLRPPPLRIPSQLEREPLRLLPTQNNIQSSPSRLMTKTPPSKGAPPTVTDTPRHDGYLTHSSTESTPSAHRSVQSTPNRDARRDSTASATSIDTTASDDPTPPDEATRKLSPVEESPATASESPIHGLRYPKVPRASNQAVPRTPPSPMLRAGGAAPSPTAGEPDFLMVPATTTAADTRRHRRGGSAGSATAGRSPRTPPGMGAFPSLPMPKLTPTRYGDELYLSVT